MEIRKLFNVEAAQHVVRNATSHRCSHSVHNHGAIVEVFLTSDKLDNGGMIVDFGILKGTIKQWIDSFDHCMCFWNKDNEEYKSDMKNGMTVGLNFLLILLQKILLYICVL